jgi:6-pyruvoyltetrahydropterin/6-carboxytetrahydropterin synthase
MVISKTYKTETAHIVRNAYSTRCKFNVHGHSYKWIVHIRGEVNKKTGMVIDFGNLKSVKQFIDQFDHTMVLWKDDDPDFIQFFKSNVKRLIIMNKNTTAENMAALVYKFVDSWLKEEYMPKTYVEMEYRVDKVEVWETETGRAIAASCDENDTITYKQIEE